MLSLSYKGGYKKTVRFMNSRQKLAHPRFADYEYSSIKEKNRLLKTVVEKAIYFRKTRTSPFALDVTFINM